MKFVLVIFALIVLSSALEGEKKKEAESFKKVESNAKNVARSVVGDKEAKAVTEGEKAIAEIRRRQRQLRRRHRYCKTLSSTTKRDDCLTEWRKDTDRNKRQIALIEKLEQCLQNHKSDSTKRKECVKKHAVDYLKLRPIKVVLEQDKRPIVKRVEKAADAAVKANNGKSVQTRVEDAIRAMYKRLADIHVARSKCSALESGDNYKECMVPVEAMIKKNREERRVVKELNKCQDIKERDDRISCVRRTQQRLLDMLEPGSPKEVPASVEELDSEVVDTAQKQLSTIVKLRRQAQDCESEKCRREARMAIEAHLESIKALKPRFSPRRECLKKRHDLRSQEFRLRAREHALLTRIHRRATECDTARCTAKQELEQQALEAAIVKRRREFITHWKGLRCPFVLPSTSQAAVKQTLRKIEESDLQSLRSMRERLVELYAKLEDCESGECRVKVRKDIDDLKKLIALLEQVQQRTLDKKRRDHDKRAQLHKLLTKYYLLAADCETRDCRLRYRAKLRDLTASLAAMDRDELGRENEASKGTNQYYLLLQRALKRCPSSSLGRTCRQMVVHAFRAGTELRQKALLQFLRSRATEESELKIKDCADSKTCVARVQEDLQKRLAELQVRDMRIEKRRALRLCELTKNEQQCREDVEREFKRDTTIAKKDAAKDAAKAVVKVENKLKEAKDEKSAVTAASKSTKTKKKRSTTTRVRCRRNKDGKQVCKRVRCKKDKNGKRVCKTVSSNKRSSNAVAVKAGLTVFVALLIAMLL